MNTWLEKLSLQDTYTNEKQACQINSKLDQNKCCQFLAVYLYINKMLFCLLTASNQYILHSVVVS